MRRDVEAAVSGKPSVRDLACLQKWRGGDTVSSYFDTLAKTEMYDDYQLEGRSSLLVR